MVKSLINRVLNVILSPQCPRSSREVDGAQRRRGCSRRTRKNGALSRSPRQVHKVSIKQCKSFNESRHERFSPFFCYGMQLVDLRFFLTTCSQDLNANANFLVICKRENETAMTTCRPTFFFRLQAHLPPSG